MCFPCWLRVCTRCVFGQFSTDVQGTKAHAAAGGSCAAAAVAATAPRVAAAKQPAPPRRRRRVKPGDVLKPLACTRAAADFGYLVLLAADACATRALAYDDVQIPAEHVHAAALAALKSYAQVMKTEEILKLLEK